MVFAAVLAKNLCTSRGVPLARYVLYGAINDTGRFTLSESPIRGIQGQGRLDLVEILAYFICTTL